MIVISVGYVKKGEASLQYKELWREKEGSSQCK